jgi:hypothetical protein
VMLLEPVYEQDSAGGPRGRAGGRHVANP